ncbi:terpene cyclase [Pleurotus pulmonarius]|nr:terpene cyclase [Pleurotus pulmonarius]
METTPTQHDTTTLADEEAGWIDVYLPRTLDRWPWPRRENPHYASVTQEASSWCESFRAFNPQAQEAFNKCNFNLLTSLVYPGLDKPGYRVACDMMNFLFCIDEHTDPSTTDAARSQVDIMMDAIRNPHKPRPSGEWVIGEMARQFWASAIVIATPTAQTRFTNSCQTFLDSVVQEAEDREKGDVRSLEDYLKLRRYSVGVEPCLAIGEMYLNIPQEVIDHPVVSKLTAICIDLIIVANDIYSYKVEWERANDIHNLVTVVIQEFKMNLQDAMDYIGNMNARLVDEFLEQWSHIPVFGSPVDADIKEYCVMMAEWVRGNDSWSFENKKMKTTLLHDQSDSINDDLPRIDIYLPKTLDFWPWPRRVNPYYARVKQQASSWCESFQLFSPRAQNTFNKFWANAVLIASPTSQVRFVDSCQTYLDALVQQAEDRAQGRVRHVEDYFTVRRGSIGAAPSIAIGALYLNIPQETLDHPVISKLTEICIDMIIISNDMYSYKVE